MTFDGEALEQLRKRVRAGGAEKYHAANAAKGKLFARERVALLVDEGSFVEDGLYANAHGRRAARRRRGHRHATIDGRPVCLMANDSTVKAGSWGARTVEKIIRIIERAYATGVPMVYLVDSAGARITDQVDLFPGRRGAGKIFWNQVRASGSIPQVCALFGPSAAGGAYIPAFCDVVAMVEGNASMYLGSDRMVEMVTGEKTTLEAMGGARVHCAESGVGHFLCKTEADALDVVRRYLSYLPSNWTAAAAGRRAGRRAREGRPGRAGAGQRAAGLRHAPVRQGPARRGLLLRDPGALGQGADRRLRPARRPGRRRGRQQLDVQGRGALRRLRRQGDPLRAALRRVQRAAALPLRRARASWSAPSVEKQGIIRHGAKMITAISEATVPKICVVVRKAYGAGLYAMAGPGFEPDATIALPTAKIAVMGAEAAVNAVYANKIAAIGDADERAAFVAARRAEYERDIDIVRLASELVVDAIVEPGELRGELIRRFAAARGKDRHFSRRRHGVTPV